MRMSLSDFEALSPVEFRAVCERYRQAEEERLHDRWERMRLLATIVVQPSLRKKMTPRQLLKFPWDTEQERRKDEGMKLSKEEHLNRFKEILKKIENDG